MTLAVLAAIASINFSNPDAIARSFMERNGVPGMAYAVVQNGSIVARGAYGVADVHTKEKVSLTSVFPIASLSKPFVAMGVLALAEANRLNLNDAVGKYIPTLPDSWKPIPLIRLLDHTSGIPDHYNAGVFPVESSDRISSDDLIAKLATLPLHFKAGEKYEYSNGNYALLAKVIEKASGQPYEQFLNDRIFSKLNLLHTAALTPETLKTAVHGYGKGKKGLEARTFNPDWCYGNGALGSAIIDLAKLDNALYSQRLLRTATLQFVTTPQPLNDGSRPQYAMGWALGIQRGQRSVSHSGRLPPWCSYFGRYPELNLTVIVLSNNGDVNLGSVAADLAGTVAPALGRKPIADSYPALTASHRAFAESIVKGRVDTTSLSEPLRRDYEAKDHWSGIRKLLSKAPIDSFEPTERNQESDGTFRSRYRIDAGEQVFEMLLRWDASGTIIGMTVTTE